MQYYKILAKEVEKRISILKPYIDSDESTEGKTGAPEISEKPSSLNLSEQDICDSDSAITSSNFFVDLSVSFNHTNVHSFIARQRSPSPPIEIPERDYNCINKTKELILDTESSGRNKNGNRFSRSFNICKVEPSDPFATSKNMEELHETSSKNFTGSLNDLYSESIREQSPQLIRQRSYTILNPSPQLLAHLKVQSLNTGVEMTCISMSESLSNLSSPNKKRRSWDLESAKVKWSSMAQELRQKQMGRAMSSVTKRRQQTVAAVGGPPRGPAPKVTPKSEPIQRARKLSPLKIASNNTTVKENLISKTRPTSSNSPKSPKTQLISESEDPAAKVRELYEKIQNQQLIQMASLVEKQKREQILLQQVFEEQNNLLFKQLKTICPKSPIEAKEAWSDKQHKPDRRPVSLSQLMDHQLPNELGSPSTQTDKFLENCKDALKRSRDLTNSLQKVTNISPQSPTRSRYEGSLTRTHSPVQRNASRRLNYETSASASADKEYEPMLTDRTNDTMADLNVTFPSDSDEGRNDVSATRRKDVLATRRKDVTMIHQSLPSVTTRCASTESAIRSMERTIQESINSCRRNRSNHVKAESTLEQVNILVV